jgi:hypothetical protein
MQSRDFLVELDLSFGEVGEISMYARWS